MEINNGKNLNNKKLLSVQHTIEEIKAG